MQTTEESGAHQCSNIHVVIVSANVCVLRVIVIRHRRCFDFSCTVDHNCI